MPQLLSITKAKEKLLELARRTEELGESFIILKDGHPISALLPFEEYEAMLETLDIVESEPDIVKKLRNAKKQIESGHFIVWKGKSSKKKAA